ncbi:MAG: YdiU family protein [Acidimicrobiaceae bacterium]|nr:YdiU family protein [Acidimicrobiaceae bacterium]
MTAISTLFDFDNTYARELEELVVAWQPDEVPAPSLVVTNGDLAQELGLDSDDLDGPVGASVLSGNTLPDGATPVAMVYAGHQFGGYSPRLGDGRAVLLGEIVDIDGKRQDLHLKGSGRTPLSRGGDGKATLGPMLREFVIAEAMHSLGVPTTRALAVAVTGEEIARNGMEPGAVLTRVASSHLRVGTFEYSARAGDADAFKKLVEYSIDRHYPHVRETEQPYLAFFEAVLENQAALIAKWMLLGFIHGVMNTDNVTISGQGIDYGPCAFMDRYDPATVFSSIDHGGRYAYGNQPRITTWNLARLAETLVSLVDDDFDVAAESLTSALNGFDDRYRSHWIVDMRAKLGIVSEGAGDGDFFDELLSLMQTAQLDYTGTFRALAAMLRDATTPSVFGADNLIAAHWVTCWRAQLDAQGVDLALVADSMDAVNPVYIPRNHLVEEALAAANQGDMKPFEELLDVVTHPFIERDGLDRFAQPAPDGFERGFKTFCGT